MKQIESVTKEGIQYIDDEGNNQFLDLNSCNKNWIKSCDPNNIHSADTKCVGWHDAYGNPPYILFCTVLDASLSGTKFEFVQSSERQALESYWSLLYLLRKVGWLTADLS
jgi:hypothetical protein